jgi:hypothetical protein
MLIYRIGLEIYGEAAEEAQKGARYNLTTVQVGPDGTIAACNGHQFLKMRAAADEPDLFTEERLGTLPATVLPWAVTVPADIVKAFLAASKRKTKKGQKEQQVVIAVDDEAITLATADGKTKRTFLIDAAEDAFPPLEKILPKLVPTITLTLGVDEMVKLLTTLQRCRAAWFTFGYSEPGAPLHVTAQAMVGDKVVGIEGAFMPMNPAALSLEATAPSQVDTVTGEILNEAPDAAHV